MFLFSKKQIGLNFVKRPYFPRFTCFHSHSPKMLSACHTHAIYHSYCPIVFIWLVLFVCHIESFCAVFVLVLMLLHWIIIRCYCLVSHFGKGAKILQFHALWHVYHVQHLPPICKDWLVYIEQRYDVILCQHRDL